MSCTARYELQLILYVLEHIYIILLEVPIRSKCSRNTMPVDAYSETIAALCLCVFLFADIQKIRSPPI